MENILFNNGSIQAKEIKELLDKHGIEYGEIYKPRDSQVRFFASWSAYPYHSVHQLKEYVVSQISQTNQTSDKGSEVFV